VTRYWSPNWSSVTTVSLLATTLLGSPYKTSEAEHCGVVQRCMASMCGTPSDSPSMAYDNSGLISNSEAIMSSISFHEPVT
jgi:hypothetical protein